MNKKGFTLVELLATITILGIIMMVAVPNVVGIVKRNKDKTYIEDAKKLVTLAEYKAKTLNNLSISTGQCAVMTMSYLGDDEFENAPNNGEYDKDKSFVKIELVNKEYKYSVSLVEKIGTNKYRGINSIDSVKLYEDDAIGNIKNEYGSVPACTYKY